MIGRFLQIRMKRLFREGFTVLDIAEALVSFDANRNAAEVQRFMSANGLEIVGVRRDGVVTGYARQEELTSGECGDHMHNFDESLILSATSSLQGVLRVLSRSEYCFVAVLGNVGGIVTRNDIQKPPVRMWLFGMITIIEMFLVRTMEAQYPDDTWQQELSEGRLKKAREVFEERKRRNQAAKLIDCLQFSDKAYILMKDPVVRKDAGFESMRAAKTAIKEIESLRNNLAHSQDLLTYNWDAILAISTRLEKVMTRI